MWSEKYRPQNISDMVGNEESRAAIMEWFAKWKKGTKPLLLVGPPGIGKTTMAFLVAKQFGYDMIGLNASDVRSKSRINEILTPVLGNVSVLGTPMIFVDEVDGIHGRGDYGGVAALVDILKEPTVPIVLAANDDTSDKMKNIKKVVKIISFKKIPPRLLRVYLENILKKESAKKEQEAFDKGEITLLGTNKHPNTADRMKTTLEKQPFLKVKKRKTLIEPIIEKRLSEILEKRRLEKEKSKQ